MFMKDFIDEILTEHTISLMEDNGIKDYVVVYPGRFQPMSRHHVATYKHLVDKFGKDKVWVASSNKQDKIKSPLDIKEKDLIAKKHGVKNFEFEVMPYVPKRILSKFNPKTTALIMITGKKDESRLGSFKRASKFSGLDNLVPFEDEKNPYMSYYIAPHKSVKTPWGELNGTLVRNVLSTPIKDEKKAKEISKMLLGWYDKKIFQLLQDKFSSIAEIDEDFIKEFFENDDTEPLEQKDFLAEFFDDISESTDEEDSATAAPKDVVAEHFANVEEEILKEKDFLAEFFEELESDEQDLQPAS